jgi:nucleotide-binding universal stress UspA family protein
MRILIGYNGSRAAMAALQDLRRAGFPVGTEAVVLTVAEARLLPKTGAEAAFIANAGKAAVCRNFPTWTVKAESVCGSPPDEILKRAESFDPDVIIVGEPCQTLGRGKILVGHTSQTILTEAECSVRIARGRDHVNSRPQNILVGFDGSAGAIHAIDSIAVRKWPTGTKVRLVAVADSSVLGSIGRFTPQMCDATVEAKFALQWVEALAAASLKKLQTAGISSSVEVQFGRPKDVVITEAERWKADTIFVGPHCAPNSLERFLIGSVSEAVSAQAYCSVEVVRKATDRMQS